MNKENRAVNKMNNEQLDRLSNITGENSYLYQLAQENSSDELKTAQNAIALVLWLASVITIITIISFIVGFK